MIKSSKVVYDGYVKIKDLDIEETKSNGETIKYKRELIDGGDAVAVLIHDEDTDMFLFTKQYRVGSAVRGEPYILDISAGMIDKGETALETAIREAKEETGAEVYNVVQIAPTFYPSVGTNSGTMTVFYANADLSNVPECTESDDEIISIVKIHASDIDINMFKTSAAVVAILWLTLE
jgi:ADP-ribose pyrophosphatase